MEPSCACCLPRVHCCQPQTATAMTISCLPTLPACCDGDVRGDQDDAGQELGGPGPDRAEPAEGEGYQADRVAEHVRPDDVLPEGGERLRVQPVQGAHATGSPRLRRGAVAEQPFDVLREDVHLEVDRVAGLLDAERGQREGGGDEADGEVVGGRVDDGQADAVDRDRALLHDVAGQSVGQGDLDDLPVLGDPALDDVAGAVDVPLDDVPAEPAAERHGALQVDPGAGRPARRGWSGSASRPSRRR